MNYDKIVADICVNPRNMFISSKSTIHQYNKSSYSSHSSYSSLEVDDKDFRLVIFHYDDAIIVLLIYNGLIDINLDSRCFAFHKESGYSLRLHYKDNDSPLIKYLERVYIQGEKVYNTFREEF